MSTLPPPGQPESSSRERGTGGERLTCEETFRRLDDYVDRELSPEERERVERHLTSCAECAGEYRFEASLIRSLRAKLDGLRVPSGLVDELRARLDREEEGADG